jgi:hypothetical protein
MIITVMIVAVSIVAISVVTASIVADSGPDYYHGNGFRIGGNQSERSRSEQENKEKFFRKNDFLRPLKPGTGKPGFRSLVLVSHLMASIWDRSSFVSVS